MSKRIKIVLDPNNFNLHTQKGMELLEKSISEVGAIESVTVDANGEVITGNARQETFEKLGYTPVFVELGENEYPVIKTNLEGEKRVKAAILANTVGKHNLKFDEDRIKEVAVEEYGIDVEELGVEIIVMDSDLSDFFAKEDVNFKAKAVKLCPHCGKDINKNASDYENDCDNEQ